MSERVDVAVVGGGPAGLSAGARAAGLGLSHVVLERSPAVADTIQKYQRGKFVMATPDALPLRSDLAFAAGSRESILDAWQQQTAERGVNLRLGHEVVSVTGAQPSFAIVLADGSQLTAGAVVLAFGVQGNLRRLEGPGADLPFVQYQLDDPDAYADETVIVIGAGDAAIENALALAAHNRVVLVNRRGEFARAKTGNLNAVTAAIESGRVECAFNSAPARIEPGKITLQSKEGVVEYPCDRVIARLGADPPRRLLEACGIVFPKASRSDFPDVSERYETAVPGIYAIGAIAGYPLIKQCMNQGYEVVQTIAGQSVEPADEGLLRAKFAGLRRQPAVSAALALVRANVRLFDGLTMLQLREFLLDSTVHVLPVGATVFNLNDYGDTLFCVVEGEVQIELGEGSGPPPVRAAGEFFGEMGLIAGRRRAATVRTRTACVLIEIVRRSALKLLHSVPLARKLIESTAIVRQLQTYLLPDLSAADLAPVIATAKVEEVRAGATLIAEGDAQDRNVFVIRSGSVTVSRRVGGKEITLAYLPAGHLVGEMALLRSGLRTATVRAAIAAEVIRIDGAAFAQLVASRPDLGRKLDELIRARLLNDVAREEAVADNSVIEPLLVRGVGEATDVLLIDESLCIRCDNCEKACAESHDGISRLDREAGPTFADVHLPTSCRHCEHPHCMADCPPDAIHRAPGGEVWIDPGTCIGCGNCVTNCPYGVIQMAAAPPSKPGLLRWLLFGSGPGPGQDQSAEHDHPAPGEPAKTKLAVKCDMCKDIEGGAACVRACPTGAALRVSPEAYFNTVRQRH